MPNEGYNGYRLQEAVDLTLVLSRDDWAMVSVDLGDGTSARGACSDHSPALREAFEIMDTCGGDDCDLPDLAAACVPDEARRLADRAGMRSYRAVRRRRVLASGRRCTCVLATGRAAPRASDPDGMRALGLLAVQLVERIGACRELADLSSSLAGQDQLPYRLLFESVPGLYVVLAPEAPRIVAVSDAYLAATMARREQLLGRTIFEAFPDDPDDAEATGVRALAASLERVRQTGLPDVMGVQRYPIRRQDGQDAGFELRYWSPINSPVLAADGSLAFIIHRVEDVTDYVLAHRPLAADLPLRDTARLEAEIVMRSLELKRLAESLAQSEQRLRYVTQATNDVIWDWSIPDDRLWCSRSAHEPFGSALARCVRLGDWEACIDPADRQRVHDSLHASFAGREAHWTAEYRLCLEGMCERIVLHRCFLVLGSDGAPQRMVGSIADLSEQKAQEAQLRMQADMLDYATDAILVRDPDNRVLYWNQAAVERYGWSSEEVLGRPVSETLYAACPSNEFAHAMEILMRHGDFSGRMRHTTADGRIIVVHVHWILVRREDGQPRAILSVVTDLSERIALEQRLLQMEKLESIGRLTGGIAHDFNNWLTVILGNSEELVEELADQPELRELARMIQMAGERGAELTRSLLAFARRQPLAPQVLTVGEVIEQLRPLIARSLSEAIDLRLLDTHHGWAVYADRGQLEAALLNLCINARDAMPDGGQLTIQLLLAEIDDMAGDLGRGLAAGEYVAIAVSDSGGGIPAEVLEHAFEPFFTTKSEAAGSGLGLSMVYGFARQSSGDVTIYSEPGHGTLVKLYLPRVTAGERHPAAQAVLPAHPPRGCSILLVEDDPMVRDHILAQLCELDLRVAAAASAEEALALLADGGTRFAVLFSDVVMPGLSGIELARRARALQPGLRVLLSSGYTFEAMQHQGHLEPGIRLLNKPYGKSLLAQTLAEVLNETGECHD
jgi:PAS domain S-box-containing protein